MMVRCAKCGSKNETESRFCVECGSVIIKQSDDYSTDLNSVNPAKRLWDILYRRPTIAVLISTSICALFFIAFGIYLIDDGLLSGFRADPKEIIFGSVFSAIGLFLIAFTLYKLLGKRKNIKKTTFILLGVIFCLFIIGEIIRFHMKPSEVNLSLDKGQMVISLYKCPKGIARNQLGYAHTLRSVHWYETPITIKIMDENFSRRKIPYKYFTKDLALILNK